MTKVKIHGEARLVKLRPLAIRIDDQDVLHDYIETYLRDRTLVMTASYDGAARLRFCGGVDDDVESSFYVDLHDIIRECYREQIEDLKGVTPDEFDEDQASARITSDLCKEMMAAIVKAKAQFAEFYDKLNARIDS